MKMNGAVWTETYTNKEEAQSSWKRISMTIPMSFLAHKGAGKTDKGFINTYME